MADDDDVTLPLSLMRVGESAMATELADGKVLTQESLAKRLVSEHALDESAASAVAQAVILKFGEPQQK